MSPLSGAAELDKLQHKFDMSKEKVKELEARIKDAARKARHGTVTYDKPLLARLNSDFVVICSCYLRCSCLLTSSIDTILIASYPHETKA